MAKPGPKRTPTKTLKLRESRLVRYRGDEPTPPDGKPAMPSWLTAAGKKCWKRVSADLDAMGLLAKTDENALARYCDCWDRWRKAQAFLAERGDYYVQRGPDFLNDQGETVKGPTIKMIKFPQVLIYERLTVILSRTEQEFGLNPSARAGLAKPKPKTSKGKARFFNQGAG